MMAYIRPQPASKLNKAQRQVVLRDYYEEYRRSVEGDPDLLNRKLPRDAFAELLDQVGELALHEAGALASQAGPVRQFLDDNPLPPSLQGRLPDEFRAFCLALNALKQWLTAEGFLPSDKALQRRVGVLTWSRRAMVLGQIRRCSRPRSCCLVCRRRWL
jgi:hypothetical protein